MGSFNFPDLTKKDVEGKKCLVRVDFNSSFNKGKFFDDFRIRKTLPLLNFLKESGARTILMTHIEEADGSIISLGEFARVFKKSFLPKIDFVADITGEFAKKNAASLKNGDIILLENLRLDKRELTNDETFCRELSLLGDLYINEAFSVSHRNHASIVGIPKFIPAYAGQNFKKEAETLSKLFTPSKPFSVFIGGRKISTKEKVIKKFLEKADYIFMGGLMAIGFFSALGGNTGKTEIDKKSVQLIKENFLRNDKIVIPDIVTVLRGVEKIDVNVGEIKDDDLIYDISPRFFDTVKDKIFRSKLILWNGPFGYLEGGFDTGTKRLAEFLASAGGKTEVIAGGGDTVSFLNSNNLLGKFSFVSTGGGAMLEFLANETLPGVEVLRGIL